MARHSFGTLFTAREQAVGGVVAATLWLFTLAVLVALAAWAWGKPVV